MTDHPTTPQPDADEVDWDALARYLTGESREGEAEAMMRWLAARADREALVAKLDGILATRAYQAPAGLDVEGALRKVHAKMAEPTVVDISTRRRSRTFLAPPDFWRMRALAGAAAVAVLAIGLPMWINRSQNEATIAEVPRVLRTAVGQRDSIILSDGSKVILGPGSELTVSAAYAAGTREVTVRGDAFFEVKHDAAHPFTVRTADALIQDIGTAFTVHSDSGDGVQVSVSEGAVEFRSGSAITAAHVVLNAGDRGTLDVAGTLLARGGRAQPPHHA